MKKKTVKKAGTKKTKKPKKVVKTFLTEEMFLEAVLVVTALLAGAAVASPSKSMKQDAALGSKFKSNWK